MSGTRPSPTPLSPTPAPLLATSMHISPVLSSPLSQREPPEAFLQFSVLVPRPAALLILILPCRLLTPAFLPFSYAFLVILLVLPSRLLSLLNTLKDVIQCFHPRPPRPPSSYIPSSSPSSPPLQHSQRLHCMPVAQERYLMIFLPSLPRPFFTLSVLSHSPTLSKTTLYVCSSRTIPNDFSNLVLLVSSPQQTAHR